MITYIVRKTKCRKKTITRYIATEKNSTWASIAEMEMSKGFRLLFSHNIDAGERKRILTRWGDQVVEHGEFINGILLREKRDERIKDILKELLEEYEYPDFDKYAKRILKEFTIKERQG